MQKLKSNNSNIKFYTELLALDSRCDCREDQGMLRIHWPWRPPNLLIDLCWTVRLLTHLHGVPWLRFRKYLPSLHEYNFTYH